MDDQVVIRASSLPAYQDCQLRAAVGCLQADFERHGWKLGPRRSNVGAIVGSAVHAAGEMALRRKMEAGTLAPLDEMEDAGVEELHRRHVEDTAEAPLLMDEASPDLGTAERQVRRMAKAYRTGVVRSSNPVMVESRLEAEALPGVTLSGKADLLHLDIGAGDKRVLRDTKTTRHKLYVAKHLAQMGAYSLLFAGIDTPPDAGLIDGIERVPVEKPQPAVHHLPFDPFRAEAIAAAIVADFARKALAFVADGLPDPFIVNPASMLCTAKYCRAHGQKVCAATRTEEP